MNNSELKFDPQTGQPLQNNELKFDPQTGQPLNNAPAPVAPVQAEPQVVPPVATTPVQPTPEVNPNASITTVQPTSEIPQPVTPQVNTVPTIEQSETEFINNAQAVSSEQQEEKAGGLNYAFIIILFVAILAAILFLFPLLT